MMPTLEQRVAALESGELERLRGLAQRRLERLRQERAAVADLRERLDAAANELEELQWAEWHAVEARDVAMAELAEAKAKLAEAARIEPGEDVFDVDHGDAARLDTIRKLLQRTQQTHGTLNVHYSRINECWLAHDGHETVTANSASEALLALWERTK